MFIGTFVPKLDCLLSVHTAETSEQSVHCTKVNEKNMTESIFNYDVHWSYVMHRGRVYRHAVHSSKLQSILAFLGRKQLSGLI